MAQLVHLTNSSMSMIKMNNYVISMSEKNDVVDLRVVSFLPKNKIGYKIIHKFDRLQIFSISK